MKKAILKRLGSFVLVCFMVVLNLVGFVVPASADSGSVYADLNTTAVTDDLEALGFDLTEYSIDRTIEAGQTDRFLVLMQVLEFGYDYHQRDFSDYGLFLYLYNPSGTDLTGTSRNQVELALKTASGAMGEYTKHVLLFLSASSDNRFYKYRVTGMTATLLRSLNRDTRTYCISGIELQFTGETNPTDFKIGGTFRFSGHQQGYGFNKSMADSLYCTYQKLETIELDLHPATWRSEYQNEKGANWRDEVDSVYFAIPNWYFQQYGDPNDRTKGLYSARVSYYERYVNGIVSDNSEMISVLRGIDENHSGNFNRYDPFSAYTTGDCEVISNVMGSSSVPIYSYRYGMNVEKSVEQRLGIFPTSYRSANTVLSRVGMSLYSGTFDSVSAEEFAQEFDRAADPRKLVDPDDVPSDFVGPVMMVESAPTGRTLGYHEETLTADQMLTYTDTSVWNENTNGVSKWFYRLFHKDESAKALSQSLNVIETVDLTDLAALAAFKNEVSAKQHYISDADIPNFLAYVASEELNPLNWTNGVFGSTVVLLRFAVTDFYSAGLTCYNGYNGASTGADEYAGNHYYFEKSYFEDFDVLSLTFQDKGGKLTTLPVVASPVDVGGDLPSPYEGATGKDPSKAKENQSPSWWETFKALRGWIQAIVIILGLVVIGLLLGIFTPILKPLFNLFGKLFGALQKFFGGVGRTVKGLLDFKDDRYEARRRRKEDKQSDEDRAFTNDEKKYDSSRKRETDRQKDEDRGLDRAEKTKESARKDRRWSTEETDLEIRDRKNKKELAGLKTQEKADEEKRRRQRQEERDKKKAQAELDRQRREMDDKKANEGKKK